MNIGSVSQVSGAVATELRADGQNGSEANGSAAAAGHRIWTQWYWLDANITREGILADLDAMQAAGIDGAMIYSLGGARPATMVAPPVEAHTPQWWDLVRLACAEARARGMTLGMTVTEGWSTGGGIWVEPPQSAQELTWAEERSTRDNPLRTLRTPDHILGHYRDEGAYAFPVPDDWWDTSESRARITASWPVPDLDSLGDALQHANVVDTEEAGWIQFQFDEPFTLRSLTIGSQRKPVVSFMAFGYNGAANSLLVEASDDGTDFRPVCRLVPPALGWQANPTELTHSIPPTTARYFRLSYDPDRVTLVDGHDGRFPVTRRLEVASIVLASRPVIDQVTVRSGYFWGASKALDNAILPDDQCIKIDDVIDISVHLSPDGGLDWVPPADGEWCVMRIGSTSNGRTVHVEGRMSGLECDKFDPGASEELFERWFGEALRQVGPEFAGDILKIVNVESWECYSQNWSRLFPAEFLGRRGYGIDALLLAMVGIPLNSSAHSERFLFDVRTTIAELISDNFYGPLGRMANARDCLLIAQAVNAVGVSDGMQQAKYVNLPCGEFWTVPGPDKPTDLREAVCGARLYGRQIIAAEAFTGRVNWDHHPYSIKTFGDRAFCIGANRLSLHTWAHQAFPDRKPGITQYGMGTLFGEGQTWWPLADGWVGYLNRCQERLQQGRAIVDVAYFMGENMPARPFAPDQLQPPLPEGYAYDSVNADALLNLAMVADGRICIGSASYAVLVIPPGTAMTCALAERLASLVAGGAWIFGERPTASPSLSDDIEREEEARRLISDLWNGSEHVGKVVSSGSLETLLQSVGIVPPVSGLAPEIMWTHRTTDKGELFFLSHQGEEQSVSKPAFRSTGMLPEIYDPVTDTTRLPVSISRNGTVEFELAMQPREALFILLNNADTPAVRAISGPDSENIRIEAQSSGYVAKLLRTGQWAIEADGLESGRIELATMPSPVAVAGPWQIALDRPAGKVEKKLATLGFWSDFDEPGLRHHSGLASYTAEFDAVLETGIHWELDLGRVADLARVYVNGLDVGVIWIPGTFLDVTAALRPGRNEIRVEVANSWHNRMVADQNLPEAERESWLLMNSYSVIAPILPAKDADFLDAGLLGPVVLRPVHVEKMRRAGA